MSERLTDAQVRHVAKLSRLKMDDQRVHFFAEQLSNVLGYIGKLNELNVEGVEPMAHPTAMTNKLREDVERPGLSRSAALANAPDADEAFFKVPKVLGESSGA
ncbi:MAG: Asp-tRNA(Asn)/Glu-tRNA(Gln) amidotransferase subunit GatC [Phycisphaerales bacterium]